MSDDGPIIINGNHHVDGGPIIKSTGRKVTIAELEAFSNALERLTDKIRVYQDEVKVLESRLEPAGTGHLTTAIDVMNKRIDELSKECGAIVKKMSTSTSIYSAKAFFMEDGSPMPEPGTPGIDVQVPRPKPSASNAPTETQEESDPTPKAMYGHGVSSKLSGQLALEKLLKWESKN